MVWFNVDDGLTTSPKVLAIPREQRLVCIGLWTMAGSWSGQHLTDGEIPEFMLTEWGADVSHGTALVDVGLWAKTSKGYRFHAWKEYQQSRADVEAKRERDRARKQAWRDKQAGQAGSGHSGTDAGQDVGHRAESAPPSPTLPSPTQPTLLSEGAAKRGTRIPEPFMVTREMREWAAKETPSVSVERATAKFVDYWRGLSGVKATKKDWLATWRNWMRSDQERAEQRGVRPTKDVRALSVVEMGRELAGLDGPKAVGA